MTIYLTNATYVDWKSLDVSTAHLAVGEGPEGGLTVLDSAPSSDQIGPADRMEDCSGRLVTKSFGLGHHHIYSTLARGMPAPHKIPENFTEILKYVWWHLDKRLDLDMIEASALASAIYSAKSGVTFIIDHHASPFAAEGSLFRIADAFDRVGVSHLLCYEISDRDGQGPREAGLAETDRYLASGRQGHVGLHASFTVGKELLADAINLAKKHKTGLHMHVAEDMADQVHCMEKYGRRVMERLDNAGALELKKSLFAHCLHLSANERKLVGESGVWVAQNTESNQNNNVGVTGYSSWTQNVIFGTDGMHSDMLRSAKASFLAGQANENLGFDGTYNRFRNIHRYIDRLGATGDGDNNLVILDYDPPTEVNSDNFLGHFVFGIDTRHVESVISNGRFIVENRRMTLVNEDDVMAFAKEAGKALWEKMSREKP